MTKRRALIAMSGGVDSSAAAALMKEQGYECVGATMSLYDSETAAGDGEKSCGSSKDIRDAAAIAENLGMPFYVLDYKEEFKAHVMESFVESYLCGCTPNPCVDCNKQMKFGHLLAKCQELGCDIAVTGHYVRSGFDKNRGRYVLRKALDPGKDQSYVLYGLSQEQLEKIYFPLGEYQKEKIRDYAEQRGLVNARKSDSQDICFVPDGDYAGFIERYCHKKSVPGNFVLTDGTVIAQHKGICHYTIGQRKGLGIAWSEPLYVQKIDPVTNEVVLGSNEELFKKELFADDFNWLSMAEPEVGKAFRCMAKIRYRHKEQPATVTRQEDGLVKVVFDEPQRAITKGQSVVLYEEDYVLGGGKICGC